MLVSMRLLGEFTITATDGEVGTVCDSLFDDQAWVIRYLVVETGSWLSSRQVLISPYAIGIPDNKNKTLPVSLTIEQVKNSPDIDTHQSVSRQQEVEYAKYYGYPFYWGGNNIWEDSLYLPTVPEMAANGDGKIQATSMVESLEAHDPHLRSAVSVSGYHIHANDGDLGHVCDLLIDEDSWAIRYMEVSTSNWWGGRDVLVPPQWIGGIDWQSKTVNLNLRREKIHGAPQFESCYELNRQLELDFYRHYPRPQYWDQST